MRVPRTERRSCSWSSLPRSRRSASGTRPSPPAPRRESQRLSQAFVDAAAAVQEEDGITVPLLDLRDHVTSSPIDGIHFEADGHRSIGTAVAATAPRDAQPLTAASAGRSTR